MSFSALIKNKRKVRSNRTLQISLGRKTEHIFSSEFGNVCQSLEVHPVFSSMWKVITVHLYFDTGKEPLLEAKEDPQRNSYVSFNFLSLDSSLYGENIYNSFLTWTQMQVSANLLLRISRPDLWLYPFKKFRFFSQRRGEEQYNYSFYNRNIQKK